MHKWCHNQQSTKITANNYLWTVVLNIVQQGSTNGVIPDASYRNNSWWFQNRYIEAYGKQFFVVNLKYLCKTILEAKKCSVFLEW